MICMETDKKGIKENQKFTHGINLSVNLARASNTLGTTFSFWDYSNLSLRIGYKKETW